MESIMEINYSNDNRLLVVLYSGHDGIYIMQEIDMNTGEIVKLYNNPIGTYKNVISMQKAQYNRDSSRIICCGNDGIFYELSRKGKILNTYLNQYVDDKAIYNLSDLRILTCGYFFINEWNIGSKPIMSLDFGNNRVTDIEYISDEKFIASFKDGTVKEFFTGTGEYIRTIISNTYNSETEKQSYCGASFDCTTGEATNIDGIGIEKIFYNPLLNRILCICQTAYLKEFDYITGKLINEIRGIHFDACYNSVGTNLFYTDVTNRCVYQMDTKTLKIIKSFQSEKDNFPKLISVNKDCTQIAIVYTNDTDGTDNLKSFDIETGKELIYLMD